MFLGKKLIGNPIISTQSGRQIGRLQDLYLAEGLDRVAGLYVGSDGLLNPSPRWLPANVIVVMSEDAILVASDQVNTGREPEGEQAWLRRDDLQSRPVDTMGGTKIGRIGDVILDSYGEVVGFSLDRVYVEGPVAERRALRRSAVYDTGSENSNMIIRLQDIEQQDIRVVDRTFFSEEVRMEGEQIDRRRSPYADTPDDEAYVSHEKTSPYVPGELVMHPKDESRTPYTSNVPVGESDTSEVFKSPYTTPEVE